MNDGVSMLSMRSSSIDEDIMSTGCSDSEGVGVITS